jgi:histone H3/H4
VAGLTIPFRTIKKAMKLDPDTPIVQNEAAIMTTIAVELFVKKLATASLEMAKSRGRQNVRYEDIAEARSKNSAMAFLEPLLP